METSLNPATYALWQQREMNEMLQPFRTAYVVKKVLSLCECSCSQREQEMIIIQILLKIKECK